MTIKSISDQLDILKETTDKAAVSKEASIDYLQRAGIINLLQKNTKHSVVKGITRSAGNVSMKAK